MNISLDTYTLQKWQNGTLSKVEIAYLDKLFSERSHKLVLSVNHLWEFCARSDKEGAILLGNFLDKFPNKIYITNPEEIALIEVRQAYRRFHLQSVLNLPILVQSWMHTLAANLDALILRTSFEGSSLAQLIAFMSSPKASKEYKDSMKVEMDMWAAQMHDYASSNNMSTDNWKIEVSKRLRSKLINLIVSEPSIFPVGSLENEDFINFMLDNPDSIPGITFPFYVQHYMHRGSSKFETSDIGDLSTLAYAPYVDFMILDKSTYNRAISVLASLLKPLNESLRLKLNKTVLDLSKRIEKIG